MFAGESIGAGRRVSVIQDEIAWRWPVVAARVKPSRKLAPGKLAVAQRRKEFVDDALLDLAGKFVLQAVPYFFKEFDDASVAAADKETAVDFIRRNAGRLKRDVAIAQRCDGEVRSEPVKLDVDIRPDDNAARVLAQALENQVHLFDNARDKLGAVVMAFP